MKEIKAYIRPIMLVKVARQYDANTENDRPHELK